MLEQIGQICLKYWVEFLLGAIVTGGGLFFKKYLKFIKEERDRDRQAHYDQLKKDIRQENDAIVEQITGKYDNIVTEVKDSIEIEQKKSLEGDTALQNQINSVTDELNCMKRGLLSMQGREFKDECRKLLEEDHTITVDEWEEIDADHEAYNALGGNHKGDALYALVKKKAENILTNNN